MSIYAPAHLLNCRQGVEPDEQALMLAISACGKSGEASATRRQIFHSIFSSDTMLCANPEIVPVYSHVYSRAALAAVHVCASLSSHLVKSRQNTSGMRCPQPLLCHQAVAQAGVSSSAVHGDAALFALTMCKCLHVHV
jgi:hypothetical protein